MATTTSPVIKGRQGSYRVCISLPRPVAERIIHMSTEQGRSISNLCAYLLETTMDRLATESANQKRTG
jgi:hypothetical protein